jgi:hypothetical protein
MARRVVGLAALALLASACEFDRQTVGQGREQLVVHAVLNPGVIEQVVYVEQSLTGRASAGGRVPFDSLDPVVTSGGVPVSGARVVVVGSDGDSAVAREDRVTRADGRGAGVYRFQNASAGAPFPAGDAVLGVRGGETYRLRVTTDAGGDVTGTTTVPVSAPRTLPVERDFDRDGDSLFVAWSEVPLAARYQLRIDTPRGPYTLFVDSLQYLVSNALRNTSVEGLPSVFAPGFRQTVQVAAVDANFHDYYRSGSDEYTGRGLLNRLQGGVGVFGSYVALRFQTLRVVAAQQELVEGRYTRTSPAAIGVPSALSLYVDTRAGGLTQLTGQATDAATGAQRGVLGTMVDDDRVTLAILRGQSARDTLTTIDGRLNGGEITGTVRGTGQPVTFRALPRR